MRQTGGDNVFEFVCKNYLMKERTNGACRQSFLFFFICLGDVVPRETSLSTMDGSDWTWTGNGHVSLVAHDLYRCIYIGTAPLNVLR